MNLQYHIETRSYSDGRIEQVVSDEFNSVRTEMFRCIINTREEQIRQTLIQLGWTPPEEA